MIAFGPSVGVVIVIVLLFLSTEVYPLSEKEILLEFKAQITDDPFNSLDSWGPSPNRDPCRDFTGVVCGLEGNVEKIILHNTSLAGVLSPSLSGLKSLQILSLFGNRFTGTVPEEFASIGTLRKLNLSDNALSGGIPDFLGDLEKLRLLDLSKNWFTGEIPPSLFRNCYITKFISLSQNNLSGEIPLSIANCSKLTGINFSFNNISGTFPSALCAPPDMAYISLRSNRVEGSVPDLFSACQSLEFLDLASNSFIGPLPFDLFELKNLSFFNASDNRFQGAMPNPGTCGDQLSIFDVSKNQLNGEISSSIANCRNLRVLNLGFNMLFGSIPADIAKIRMLSVLVLGNNFIQGTIPAELGGLELLQILDLHNLQLVGEVPEVLSNCRFLLELDLSGNRLQGRIPRNLYNMTYLKLLDLHKNLLSGDIPPSLGQLSRLQYLDLSENSLTGPIPPALDNLTLLTHFNVSFNNLSGTIPSSPIFQQFGPSAFAGNPGLCGSPLNNRCSASGAARTSKSGRVLSVSAIVAIVAAAAIFTGVCIISLMNIRARRRRRDEEVMISESTPPSSTETNITIGKLVLFSKSLPSKYEDWEAGTKALLDKECLIGVGSIGTVYRTSFEGGISIAVKKLETLGRIRNQEEFEQEIGRLGKLHHPNLVVFQGYYWSSSMQLILSQFVPNGNLHQHLHRQSFSGSSTGSIRSELHWARRFRIALGTARAVAYLHHDCKPQVLHLNIKATNILLDETYEAKLSDYGLGKLLPMLDNYALTKFHTAVGYVAPELASQGLSLKYGDKCDVYSFGVILLELVTGRKPVESPAATEVVVLRDYVRDLLEEGSASDCFDRSLRGFSENELIQVMKLGLICTSEAPTRRPSMAEIVQVLESIKPNSES
ncbi:probable LRR receptor-like serine/threonine-protein kinase At1g12460 [Aristolochia californica]|uniref:probable LRR receptor-like serine/threonine-protein kinase At1g12460 n=1 Tax=Aristolochia californica TaxID=171875 RepID=UPI0035DF14CF